MKKIPQTDAIFENVLRENQASDENPKSLRVSIDTKAKVKIGNLSRGGKARTLEAKAADDHDTQWQSVLVPLRFSTPTLQNYRFTWVSRLRLVILSSIV